MKKKEKEEKIFKIKTKIEELKRDNEINSQQQEFFGEKGAIHALRRTTAEIEKLEKELKVLEK